MTLGSDINRDNVIKQFIILSVVYVLLVGLLLANGNGLWHRVLNLEVGRNLLNLNIFLINLKIFR